MGVSGQRHSLAALSPGKRPGTHCTGCWVGPRASGRVRKISPAAGFDPRTVQARLFYITCFKGPIPAAGRSKAWVCGSSLAGVVGSNPAGGTDVCLL